ncbi:PHD finger protein 7 [Eupeodes corollae]|uniref:PHD finger protein 7 n=1 Tax=Eupeodes corollae TaxID=290404 RepID=UPI00248F91EE|nr:PHD finger protein 7 [Eupeodes corollae]
MQVCSVCKKEDDNPTDYGEFMKRSDICVHYYCLLLSTNLPQKGLDYSGILGFLLRDIRIEIKKCAEKICCYCKEPNASISCFKCKTYFHNICANNNGCVSEFINEFHSYCHKHVPFGNEKMLPQQNTSTCWICHDALGEFSPTQTLRSYCCKNGYVHRHCLRKYALTAGYHLACLWCTSKAFRDDVRKHGVFVPDREAIWDNNETLRYTDLHRGYSQCDAKVCQCPQGREFFRGPWKLIVCCTCGASGVHNKCGRDKISKNIYTCDTCRQILARSKQTKDQGKNAKAASSACNYTMFMSKTCEDSEEVGQIVTVSSVDSLEEEQNIQEEDKGEEDIQEEDKEEEDMQEDGKEQENIQEEEKEKDIFQENKEDREMQEEGKEQEQENIQEVKQAKEPPTPTKKTQTKNVSSPQKKSQLTELFVFGRAGEIVGTVQVEKDKLQEKPDKTLFCKEEDAMGFSSSDALLNSIFSDILEEGRELSEDMVDEVFERYKLLLETFGDPDD